MRPCPCGSARAFRDCCAQYIEGSSAPTAEALMRSRYSAFTVGNLDYIERTSTPDAAHLFNRIDMELSLPDIEWLGIEVHGTNGGGLDDTTGEVSFAVRYRYQSRTFTQVEKASFKRADGIWLYDKSEINPKSPPVRVVHVGRNDPCPCGSGKKYKKCCGSEGSSTN